MEERFSSKRNFGTAANRPIYCRKGCGRQIIFDKSIRSQSGKLIPLNLDHSKHECPADPYHFKIQMNTKDEQLILQAKQYVREMNNRLTEEWLELIVHQRQKGMTE